MTLWFEVTFISGRISKSYKSNQSSQSSISHGAAPPHRLTVTPSSCSAGTTSPQPAPSGCEVAVDVALGIQAFPRKLLQT